MTLLELLDLLKKHLKLVIILPVVAAVLVAVYSVFGMKDVYTASTSMYVLVSQDAETATSTNLSQDLNASQMISNDVATLLKSDRIVGATAKKLGLADLSGYSVAVQNNTTSRVITLDVTGRDPQMAARISNAMSSEVSGVARDVMSVESVNIIDEAVAPQNPSGPNRKLYVAVAALAGLFAAVAIVVIEDMLNTKVRDADEIEQLLDLPVVGHIPYVKEGK